MVTIPAQWKEQGNILCLNAAHLGHVLCLQTTGEGNLTGSSLTIYFHHRSAKLRQAKFVSFACHRSGSFVATFPVGVP